jgi:hypothetical protein
VFGKNENKENIRNTLMRRALRKNENRRRRRRKLCLYVEEVIV